MKARDSRGVRACARTMPYRSPGSGPPWGRRSGAVEQLPSTCPTVVPVLELQQLELPARGPRGPHGPSASPGSSTFRNSPTSKRCSSWRRITILPPSGRRSVTSSWTKPSIGSGRPPKISWRAIRAATTALDLVGSKGGRASRKRAGVLGGLQQAVDVVVVVRTDSTAPPPAWQGPAPSSGNAPPPRPASSRRPCRPAPRARPSRPGTPVWGCAVRPRPRRRALAVTDRRSQLGGAQSGRLPPQFDLPAHGGHHRARIVRRIEVLVEIRVGYVFVSHGAQRRDGGPRHGADPWKSTRNRCSGRVVTRHDPGEGPPDRGRPRPGGPWSQLLKNQEKSPNPTPPDPGGHLREGLVTHTGEIRQLGWISDGLASICSR